MQLSEKSIEEFKAIHKKQYGTELDDAEARESARRAAKPRGASSVLS